MENNQFGLIIQNPANGEFLKKINWNKQEIMDKVAGIMQQYDGLVYSEDQMKQAKVDRASLNSMKKAITDRRIEVKKAILAPYETFESEVKEVLALVEKPIALIDGQIKDYEERLKAEKKEALVNHYNEKVGKLADYINFDMLYDSKWLNLSVTLKKAKEELEEKIYKVESDMEAIDEVCEDKHKTAVKSCYLKELSLSNALAEAARLKELDRKIEEENRRKEEARIAAEKARIEAEKARLEAEKAKQEAEAERKKAEVEKAAVSSNFTDSQEEDREENGDDECQEESDQITEPEIYVEKKYRTSFSVRGTMEQIKNLKEYIINNGIEILGGK